MKWQFTFGSGFTLDRFGLLAERITYDAGVDRFKVVEYGVRKDISKWAICMSNGQCAGFTFGDFLITQFNGVNCGIVCHYEKFSVREVSLVKEISKLLDDRFVVEDWIKTKRGHLPVYRFRVKMYPVIRYNVKHDRVSSNDGEGW